MININKIKKNRFIEQKGHRKHNKLLFLPLLSKLQTKRPFLLPMIPFPLLLPLITIIIITTITIIKITTIIAITTIIITIKIITKLISVKKHVINVMK